MTEFSIVHEFEADPQRFWRVFLDSEFLDEWYRSAGMRRQEVSRDDGTERLIMVARYVAERQLPAVVRSVIGGKQLGYTETATFDKQRARLDHVIEMNLMTDRVRFGGAFTVEPIDGGRVRQRYAGSIAVDLPLVGKKIEQSTVKEMERSHEAAAHVTRAWLQKP
jgi:uncharacterized protein YndB with AHSA1/START domain